MARNGRMNKRCSGVRVQGSGFREQGSGSGIKKAGLGLLAIMIIGGAAWAGDAGVVQKVGVLEKPSRLVVPLPPLAKITGTDESGATWQQTGTLPGALAVASGDLRHSLRAGGWIQEKTIPLGRKGTSSALMIWTSRGHRILVMVWEKEPGLSGFSWGEER